MLLRPRQALFVQRSIAALLKYGNTLAIAPTGAGKTIIFSTVIGRMLREYAGKACILAHRDELIRQNNDKFSRINPRISTSIVNAEAKSWAGRAIFAMVPTLARQANLDGMPKLDILVIDEAHHAAAASYQRIIDVVRDINPNCLIYGLTATPARGDKKALRSIFTNVADHINLDELIQSGHLVPPRTFVIDVGTQKALRSVRRTAADFDMDAVSRIMNQTPVTEAVIDHWKQKAGDRKTVVFCATVNHAKSVTAAFNAALVNAVLVHGDLADSERRAAIDKFEKGGAQVVVNVMVLTEGWDYQPIDCVVLLRPSSYKSTMIQMIGRGLRTVDPTLHHGIVKTDCIVLDFGISSLTHGTLEQDVNLDKKETAGKEPEKEYPEYPECPECLAIVPRGTQECPTCGYVWQENATQGKTSFPLTQFKMSEIDLLRRTSFQWVDLFNDDSCLIATGFHSWSGVFCYNKTWYAIGGIKGEKAQLLSINKRVVCLAAADDWLNQHETDETAHKSKQWLQKPPTEKQLYYIHDRFKSLFPMTRYYASNLITFQFNKNFIQRIILANTTKR